MSGREFTQLFASQGGAAHRAQLLPLSVARQAIDRRLAAGTWVELEDQVYSPAGTPHTLLRRCWSAYLAVVHSGYSSGEDDRTSREAAVIGTAAACLTVDDWPDSGQVCIGTPWRQREIALSQATHVRLRTWPQRRFVLVSGLPVAAPADLVLDLAPELSPAALLSLAQRLVFGRRTTTSLLRNRCGRGIAGSAAVRDVCVSLDRREESLSERVGVRALRAAGFVVETGVQLAPSVGRTDFCIRGRDLRRRYGLAGEIDGPHHDLPVQQERDERKDTAVEEMGYTARRWKSAAVLADTAGFVRSVERAVAEVETRAA